MQFKIVVLGVILVMVGLIAYTSVPNVHRSSILTTQLVMLDQISVFPNGQQVLAKNIAVSYDSEADLKINLTVTGPSGELDMIRFQVFPTNTTQTCAPSPKNYPIDQVVSNETLIYYAVRTGTLCFVFNNMDHSIQNYSIQKTVHVSATLDSEFEEIRVTNDGQTNMAGLGLGAFGVLVLLYGLARKTVIPWE